jgi:serine/threonine protein kinase
VFHTEARAMAAARHSNIATVFDFGRCDDGKLFYTMELVPGRNLRNLLEADGRMAWPRVHRITRQVADALGEIHAVGIVHRDLKPANIMIVDGDDRVTIGSKRLAP